MCPSHFSKVFKSILGQPPRDFVLNLRLNEARRRLSKRQKTLRTVSESVGFRTSLAFQEAFERKFGARPSTYLHYEKPLKHAMSNGSGSRFTPPGAAISSAMVTFPILILS